MMKAAQLMALAVRPIVVRSMPASRQPALVTELVIEWVMQMTVYATKEHNKSSCWRSGKKGLLLRNSITHSNFTPIL